MQNKGRFSFLITGAGRGGTSLLAAMLHQHPRLAVGFEQYAVSHLMNGKLDAFFSLCRQMAKKNPQSIWGNKVTSEQWQPAWQSRPDEVLKHLKNLKVIYILRDGRRCVPSKMNRAGLSYPEAVERWKFSIHLMEQWREKLPHFYTLTFEALLQQPEKNLQSVCHFLKLPFHRSMLEATQSELLPEDYRHAGILPEKALSHPLPPQWEEDMRPELLRLGYGPSGK